MVKEIEKNIWLLEIPMPKSPIKSINSYLIKGEKRHLLIDTGYNCPEAKETLLKSFKEIGIDIKDIDIFLTHGHCDHAGLVPDIVHESRDVYCNKTTYEQMNYYRTTDEWRELFPEAEKMGLEKHPTEYFDIHPGFLYNIKSKVKPKIIEEGHKFYIGGYILECIAAPGHTPDMFCLYEKTKKMLFSGDHILGDIIPNIQCWSLTHNPLLDYLDSLNKVSRLHVERVFPSHGDILENLEKRITEIQKSKLKKVNEVEEILKEYGEQSPYEVITKLRWRMPVEKWDEISPIKKWFATGEIMSCLSYLYHQNKITINLSDFYGFKINKS
jgi:glyoxylase-like metal-dependent hydrolase (beta-lactamase superfamily II)